VRIRKAYRFEASHMLPNHTGKCANLHGHSYRIEVTIGGPIKLDGEAAGMIMDFAQLSDVVIARVVEPLDHTHLNDTLENPTCERLLIWIWDALKVSLPTIYEIVLWETETSCAIIRLDDVEVTL
jgi:6-pyruvoyltetrahydropterin/6-carboxytetrahydropterin synthase